MFVLKLSGPGLQIYINASQKLKKNSAKHNFTIKCTNFLYVYVYVLRLINLNNKYTQ